MINWQDPKSKITTNFTVKDGIYLPTWSRLANESDGLNDTIKENLINVCAKMEAIRILLGNRPIHVHCMYRPEMYNKIIGGSTKSQHMIGNACDFSLVGGSTNKDCDMVRETLKPELENLNIRMEDVSDKSNRAWVHIDLKVPSPNRYFKP